MTSGVLQTHQVCYKVGCKTIVQSISLTVQPGEILVLAGPNGAGKSTLVGLLAGDHKPTSGQVTLDGRSLERIKPSYLARYRSVMLQHSRISFPFTVTQVVQMGRAPYQANDPTVDSQVVAAALAATGTANLADRVFQTLSGGEKARVTFARVLAQQTPTILLDEPTAALDIHHQELIMSLARREADQGRAVLAVLHDLSLAAAWADRLALLNDGELVAIGSVSQVVTADRLSSLYCHPIKVWQDDQTGTRMVVPKRGAKL
ncbi:MAG: heme ABC transporter ATP-binding protein [Bifidobacteriaceae bacterium]|jgi:iron complex transport system ATP-binding protein|nr:heme ABC transporter ATP-binding protein [Bifidobacteriaceae bacterium]